MPPESVSPGKERKHPGFADRADAGRQLAQRLLPLADRAPLVLGLPRGGIPVAREVALALDAELDCLCVRKLGAPGNPEYGIGAIAEGGVRVVDREAAEVLHLVNGELDRIVATEEVELRRRVAAYRGERPPADLAGRTVVVVDDGVATGLTDIAALRAARRRRPARLVLAVPVCAPESIGLLRAEADELVVLITPSPLWGVGNWYRDFSQVADEEVVAALREFGDGGRFGSARGPAAMPGPGR